MRAGYVIWGKLNTHMRGLSARYVKSARRETLLGRKSAIFQRKKMSPTMICFNAHTSSFFRASRSVHILSKMNIFIPFSAYEYVLFFTPWPWLVKIGTCLSSHFFSSRKFHSLARDDNSGNNSTALTSRQPIIHHSATLIIDKSSAIYSYAFRSHDLLPPPSYSRIDPLSLYSQLSLSAYVFVQSTRSKSWKPPMKNLHYANIILRTNLPLPLFWVMLGRGRKMPKQKPLLCCLQIPRM